MGVTGGAGVAATLASGGAPAAHCFCSPVQNVRRRQFLAVSYSAYQLCEQEVQQWSLEEPAEECWQLRQRPPIASRHPTPHQRHHPSACSALWWSGDWIIRLVTGRYLALHQPRSKSFTARTAVSAPVHRPLCSGVITGGLLMGGLSSSSQGSISFLAGLILIRVSERRHETKQVCS